MDYERFINHLKPFSNKYISVNYFTDLFIFEKEPLITFIITNPDGKEKIFHYKKVKTIKTHETFTNDIRIRIHTTHGEKGLKYDLNSINRLGIILEN